MTDNPPVIGFELGVGEFRIVTAEAIYQIKVLPELITANTNLGVISQPLGEAPAPGPAPSNPPASGSQVPAPVGSSSVQDPSFFQELSQELFQSVGQLARQLSVSVGELPEDAPGGDLSKTGADLEDAKGQLQDVIELTEKASMTIMDLADEIQSDMDGLIAQMHVLNNLGSLLTSDGSTAAGDSNENLTQAPGQSGLSLSFMEKFSELQSFVERFQMAGTGDATTPESAAAPSAEADKEAAEPLSVIAFDLDVVFQTMYEFCTNESVKEHIKAMREANAQGGFRTQAVEEELSRQAADLEPDDGFYNFPTPGILKLLYSNTANEEFKQVLKKMNQTVDSIFLEGQLPVEGREVTLAQEDLAELSETVQPPAVAEESPPEGGGEAPTLEDMLTVGRRLKDLEELLPAASAEGAAGSPGAGYASISFADRDTIVKAVASSEDLIQNTTVHLTHIMEALSFQDLSGQRIKKIVNLISEIQVQLLSMLVSVNSKMKAHHEAPTVVRPREEQEKVAQEEVDKMLEKLSAEPSELKGPGGENRLDQGAVNDLLAQLGF
ncbi:MAG: protein phosphatase CheZ [Deltaproteobacteria bacterium]|jgi:chemotaxis regulatin CheY-phosphate phosphatase CheZ|nr:protein phosphatase CheZ [Deltaproteobacteria bacterium]